MDQRIFIAGSSGVLSGELAQLYSASGSKVSVAFNDAENSPPAGGSSPGHTTRKKTSREKPEETFPEGSIIRIPWNRRSSLSSQSAVFKAITALGGIDKAFIIHSPGDENRGFHELSSGYIEETVDRGIKGYLFLLREIIGYFQKNGRGIVSLVIHDEGSEVQPPIEACIAGSFKTLSESLFTFYQNEPATIVGFQSASTNAGEYAQYIFRSIEEKQVKTSNHWKKYGDKPAFLQSLPLGIRRK